MEKLLELLTNPKTAAALVVAVVWGVLAVLGSPDRNTAMIVISIIVVGLCFAVYTVNHNNAQDARLNDCAERERDCNDTLGGLRTAVAILHTRASQNDGRRGSWPLPALEQLIGEDHASHAMEEANRYIPKHAHRPERRRKQRAR